MWNCETFEVEGRGWSDSRKPDDDFLSMESASEVSSERTGESILSGVFLPEDWKDVQLADPEL
jgi:hypothetical protein